MALGQAFYFLRPQLLHVYSTNILLLPLPRKAKYLVKVEAGKEFVFLIVYMADMNTSKANQKVEDEV